MRLRKQLAGAFSGLVLGAFAYWVITWLVTFGWLHRFGIVGVVSFPIYEEFIKLAFAMFIIISLKLDFKSSMMVAIMVGLGFRIYEMELVSKPTLQNFVLPAIVHSWGVVFGVMGITGYKETKVKSKLFYVLFAVFYHLGWNIIVDHTEIVRLFIRSLISNIP